MSNTLVNKQSLWFTKTIRLLKNFSKFFKHKINILYNMLKKRRKNYHNLSITNICFLDTM